MEPRFVISFARGVLLEELPGGECVLQGPRGPVPLGKAEVGVLAALRALALGDVDEEELQQRVLESTGPLALASLRFLLQRRGVAGLVRRTLWWQGAPLASVTPGALPNELRSQGVEPDHRYQLSRLSVCRQEGARLLIESPASATEVTLLDRRCGALLVGLAAGASARELSGELPELVTCHLLGLLLGAGALCSVDASGDTEEPPALATWEPHDLLFHTRSRRGRHARPYGGTYRFLGRTEPLPLVAPPPPGAERVALHTPDLAALEREDLPFTRVLEQRRSRRTPGEAPLTAHQLGELLYRAARLRGRPAGAHEELGDRPYPSGGALYELDIHPVIHRCTGLDPGLYRYDPEQHALYRIRGEDARVRALLAEARAMAGAPEVQVLLVLGARFQRVMWKYESLAYALILKDTGVLLQTLCLVAEAMGLAACPLGGGDSERFSLAAGTDPLVETSVGELILGSRSEAP